MKGISTRNNHIQITFSFDGKRYRKTLKIVPSPSNLKYAARQREAWIHEFSLGTTPDVFINKEVFLLSSILERWLQHKEKEVKASTYNDYCKSVKVLNTVFGHLNVSELTIGQIRDYCLESPATAKRLNNFLSPLRQALQEAVEDEIITKNILSGWSCRKRRKSKPDPIDPFNSLEQDLLLNMLTGQAKNLIQFALWTGMRTSEYIALKWSDVDFNNKTIRVERALTQAAKTSEEPKTKAGERLIKLLTPAYQALQAQKQHTFSLGNEIFHNPKTNKPWTGDQQVRKTLWIPAINKCKVRYRRPYQTRHTYASMMLSAGEHPMWVANQMGHADWTMIATKYGKWMSEAQPDAGEKAEMIFGSKF